MGSGLSTMTTARADGCPVDHDDMPSQPVSAHMSTHATDTPTHAPRTPRPEAVYDYKTPLSANAQLQQRHQAPTATAAEAHHSAAGASAACPVDHDNMSKEQIAAFLHGSKPATSIQHAPAQKGDGCPVDHENMTPEQIAVLMSHARPSHPTSSSPPSSYPPSPPSSSSPSSYSPTSPSASRNDSPPSTTTPAAPRDGSVMYDVYGQQLNADNLMPAVPNQLPSPGQRTPLSTDREQSTIPKPGSDASAESPVWTYPSPQMFFNALKRKGKADDVAEADMNTVVAVHNRMNERTWAEVCEWERRFHCATCPSPKLMRFQGRPHDLSPVARFRMWFRAYPRPFDRHDWVVDRCGKEDARYVIDYYYRDGPDPIEIHVRPAVDSFTAAFDRMRAGLIFLRGALGLPPPSLPKLAPTPPVATTVSVTVSSTSSSSSSSSPSPPPAQWPGKSAAVNAHAMPPAIMQGDTLDDKEFDFLTGLTPDKIGVIADDVQTHCSSAHAALASAAESGNADSAAMEKANTALNYCMAKRICKPQARSFMAALESGADPATAYGDMAACLDRFQIMAHRTLLEAAGIKQLGPEFPQEGAPSVARLINATTAPATPNTEPASSME